MRRLHSSVEHRFPAIGDRVLFLSAHYIATEERAVIRFIEGAVRELQNRSCGIFLACITLQGRLAGCRNWVMRYL